MNKIEKLSALIFKLFNESNEEIIRIKTLYHKNLCTKEDVEQLKIENFKFLNYLIYQISRYIN